jgi:DNA-binding MarR family transcriptional regulator
MKMNELSRRMMVTGGNITPVTDQLVKEGWVERMELPHDRRAWLVRLTPAGRSLFKKMAKRHEAWIVAAFSSLSQREVHQLHELLGQVKKHSQSSVLENP